MGASVIHGQRLSKQVVHCRDGCQIEELSAEEGDSVSMSYSSVSRMVAFCAERGVREEDWPIYYGVWEGDADLNDIAARCGRLRQSIARLDECECAAVTWLTTVRGWLAQGEVFAVFE
jgi:hypothetical protein